MSRKRLLVGTLLAFVLFSANAAFADLLAYFPFSEGSGTETADITGNGNDGTFNADVEWVAGYDGTGVRFDTAGERIVIGPIDPSAGTDAMTLAAWINWEGEGHSIGQQGIIGKRQGWDPGTGIKWFWQAQPSGALLFRADWANGGGAGLWWGNSYLTPYANEWAHVALTWDNGAAIQYINGEQVSTGNISFQDSADDTPVAIGCVSATNNESFVGTIDEVRIYDQALTAEEIVQAMVPGKGSGAASSPSPSADQTDVPQDIILSWKTADFTVTRDVYFGTVLEDVTQATTDNPLGVLVGQGQTEASYDPEGLLEFGQTYYWRVDEANAPPDSTVYPGPVWSFTVEPYAYAVDSAGISVTASSENDSNMGPGKTIDGSGLNAADQHSTTGMDMWLSAASPDGAWIQYEFDQALMLDEMWIWNQNQLIESFIGFGLNAVVVEHSADGENWSAVEGATQFAQAPGKDDYTANTIVDLGGIIAQYVRITASSNWGAIPQFGLSEVRFFSAPVQARAPQPADGADIDGIDVLLRWRSGRGVAAHEVMFGTDGSVVADNSALVATVDATNYDPGLLNLGTAYFWKINEVNETATPAVQEGEVWSFYTPEWTTLENFDQYDDDCNRIFFTWLDGWGHNGGENIEDCDVPAYGGNGTGSLVGNDQAPFAERGIVNSGRQSMPLDFDNSIDPYYSETSTTDRALPQDWTQGGPENLSVALRGNPAAFVENADGSISMSGAGADIYNATDEFRFAYKRLNGDGSITARVDSLTDTHDWAKAGVMIREGLEPANLQAHMIVAPRERTEWLYRDQILGNTTGPATDVGTTPFPHWVRITRSGNTITGQRSSDGVSWTSLTPTESSTVDLDLLDPVYIGLAVTSHVSGVPAVAEFSNVTITGASGPWSVEAVGVEQPSNDAEPVYLVVEDGAGRDKMVTHPDPAATQIAEWQEWVIPLTEFDNLNLASIKSVSIGVGNPNSPQAGGTGKLYIDDIRLGSAYKPVGLVAHYALENSTSDSSGNAHNGVAVGDPAYVDGATDLGLAFDGTGAQYVDLGTFDPSQATGKLSVSLWANWQGLSGEWQGLIGKRDTWNADDMMWQIEANRDSGAVGFARNGSSVPSGNPVLTEGEWTHIAVSFDGSTGKFYVNGAVTGEGSGFSFGSDKKAAIQFGCCQANGGNPFNGALDEIRLYDYALSDEEVLGLAGQ